MKKKNRILFVVMALAVSIGMSSCYYGGYGPPRPHRPHHHHGGHGGHGGGYGGGCGGYHYGPR